MERNDASKSDLTVEELEAEISGFQLEIQKCVKLEKEARAAEDPDNSIYYAKEIFDLQQDRLRLDVEIQLRKNKINRIRLGME